MTRAWKQFTDSPRDTSVIDGPPPTVAERAEDERYANAVNALACIFRVDIEQARRATGSEAAAFARLLAYVAALMRDGWNSTDALYPRDVFDQHGPGAVLLALKRAYELPQPSTPLVGD